MPKVQEIEKNAGTKIPYRVSGTKIYFGADDDLMLNLAKRQREYPVSVDICADGDGNLVIGTGVGRDYVAQVDIPPYQYAEADCDSANDNAYDNADDNACDNVTQARREPLPINMADVIVTLWSVDGAINL